MLSECGRRYTISANTAARLRQFNDVEAEPLYHPPPLADTLRHESYGAYLLSLGRLEPIKRVELAIEAMRHADEPLRLLIAGAGSHGESLRRTASAAGVTHRVEFLGRVSDQALVDLYVNALAVVYPPYDEDYGYVTLEAFLARKPVVSATDAGGPLGVRRARGLRPSGPSRHNFRIDGLEFVPRILHLHLPVDTALPAGDVSGPRRHFAV